MTMTKTKQRIERILVLQTWLHERVTEVYRQYCTIFKKSEDGIDRYEIGPSWISLKTVWSRRGCTDYDYLELPVSWLYMEEEERLDEMWKMKEEDDTKYRLKQKQEKQAELDAALAKIARLSKELN